MLKKNLSAPTEKKSHDKQLEKLGRRFAVEGENFKITWEEKQL